MNTQKEKNNDFTQGIEVGRREGKFEVIKDKKLVPIEKVMEIIDKKINMIKDRTQENRIKICIINCLIAVKSQVQKLGEIVTLTDGKVVGMGELAKSSIKTEDAQKIIPSDAPIQDKSEDLK